MRRREFITLLGGAAAAWPLAARAQQAERMRRISVLLPQASDDPEAQLRVGAFLQELRQLGWIIGRNLRVDYRWGGGNANVIRKHAAELAALAPDVILAHGASAVGPLLQTTRTVPIVFPVVGDSARMSMFDVPPTATADLENGRRRPPALVAGETIDRDRAIGRKSALDAGQRRRIAERYAAGETMAELARDYSCGEATIWRALHG